MNSALEMFIVNLKILIRNKNGLFWTLVMPAVTYIALSVLPIPKFSGSNLNYSQFVLPGIIAYTIMSSGIYSLAYWLTDLKGKGVIKRFLATPIKIQNLIFGLVASRLVVMFIQFIFLTLIGMLFFHTAIAGNFLTIFFLVILGGGIFLLIGLLISNIATSYESAAPLTAAIGMPFTFLGDIFFPIDALPKFLRIIADCLPISHLSGALRIAFLQDITFNAIKFELFILSLWLLALILFTLKVFKLKE